MAESSERSVFLQALDEETSEAREAFLARACAGDKELRAAVDQLLAAHERPDNPLDQPVAERESGLFGLLDTSHLAGKQAIAEQAGTVIGPYKLMEQIGEGGFGLVFVAEQQEPVRRKVALKIVKPGMDTRDVIARFEAERQALALMDHPNIASVFDAGTYYPGGEKGVGTLLPERPDGCSAQKSPDPFFTAGRPYFVMELVRGVPITEFCDNQQLDTRQRLELFVTVCHAVQHAHQKGVIHRDLKPTNVLVTLHDGIPVPKVIDFGVAKAMGQSLTDKTIYTRFAAMIGTPLYMSPEQAEMSGLDVDTRSDIYSLGVLLYELLTGSTPFDQQRLQSAGLDELRRIIREEEPPKPSTRLSTLGGALSTASAKRRRSSVEQLSQLFRIGNRSRETKTVGTTVLHLVRGDLDWIVMKAIEKDRSRRYETAAELAADVQRFLNDEPIEARPPSRLYKIRKFARRNKVALAAAFTVATAMILATGISIWQAALATSERNDKEAALQESIDARQEADEARGQVEKFSERLTQASALLASGRAHADAGRWSDAYTDYTEATELQPKYYLVWVERGSFYTRLGLWSEAANDYEQAIKLAPPTDGPSWWGVPQLLWYTGNKKGYRRVAGQMLRDASSGSLDWNKIRCGLIAPLADVDPVELADQAEKMLEENRDRGPRGLRPRGDAGWPDRPRPNQLGGPGPPHDPGGNERPGRPPSWNGLPGGLVLYVTGWAQYRAGEFELAIERLKQSNEARWPGQGIANTLLAMAYHSAGRGDEARQALEAADQLLDRWTEEKSQGDVGRLPMPWFDWIEFLVLHREAKILLTGFAPPDDPRLQAAAERALSAIQPAE